MSEFWSVPPLWSGETAYIVAGGPSVSGHDLSKLQGRRVLAINSSCFAVPFCDYVFAMDARWIRHHLPTLKAEFVGRLVTCCASMTDKSFPSILRLKKEYPPGLSGDPATVRCRRTSLAGAINLVVHLDAKRIVLVGADGRISEDGRSHHHEPHPWPMKSDAYEEQEKDLRSIVGPLGRKRIDLINVSPVTAWGFLGRTMTFDETLSEANFNDPSLYRRCA